MDNINNNNLNTKQQNSNNDGASQDGATTHKQTQKQNLQHKSAAINELEETTKHEGGTAAEEGSRRDVEGQPIDGARAIEEQSSDVDQERKGLHNVVTQAMSSIPMSSDVALEICNAQKRTLATLQIANDQLESFNRDSIAEFEHVSGAQRQQRDTLKRVLRSMSQISRRVAVLNHRIENHLHVRSLQDPGTGLGSHGSSST